MRNILSSSRRPAFAAAVASAIIFLSACANGPSDFLSANAAPDGGDGKPPIRSLAERRELANSLETEARRSAAAASTDAGTSVREMEALRQGQNHQAERLRAALNDRSFPTPVRPKSPEQRISVPDNKAAPKTSCEMKSEIAANNTFSCLDAPKSGGGHEGYTFLNMKTQNATFGARILPPVGGP